MTPQQNKILHSLLTQLQLMPQKQNLIFGFTNGKSQSSKDMSYKEAQQLISYLNQQSQQHQEASNTMRRKILSMAHRLLWLLPNGKVDVQRVNNWCIANSYLKKPLNKYSYTELPQLVSQFTTMYQYYVNKVNS